MLNLIELEQFVAFSELGTLLKVSEKMNISQPTLTRNMKHVEEAFGVPLFIRGKNRLELNKTGERAVEYAKKILSDADEAVAHVQAFDQSQKTILVATCAPAPLWELLPKLSTKYPKNIISSKMEEEKEIIKGVMDGIYKVGIVVHECKEEGIVDRPFLAEELFACVPKDHTLASKKEVSAKDLNGFNCLLRDQIGFWFDFCYKKMPASKFLIQTDEFEFWELVEHSTLLCFTSNLATGTEERLKNRVILPISDEEATVTYHLIQKKEAPII